VRARLRARFPAVVHWKSDAALVDQRGERYLIEDLTFHDRMWLSRAAPEDESSGYFLVPGRHRLRATLLQWRGNGSRHT
jgi:hypothetical protein